MRRLRIFAFQFVFGLALLEACLQIYNPLPFRVRGNRIVLPVRKTWTDVLERRVHAMDPEAWVNNAGFDGQSTYGHYVLLRDYVAGLRPAIAIFLVGINDIGLERSNDFDGALDPTNTVERAVGAFIVDHSEIAALGTNLYRGARTHLAGFGHSETDIRTLPVGAVDEAAMQRTLTDHQRRHLGAYEERLARLADLSRAHRIEPIFVTQPALYGDAIDPATGVDLATVQFHRGRSGARATPLPRVRTTPRPRANPAQLELAHAVARDSGAALIRDNVRAPRCAWRVVRLWSFSRARSRFAVPFACRPNSTESALLQPCAAFE